MIQAFWGAGKSYISSTVVPLMDWAERPGATEGRTYLDEDLSKKWTGRLMQIVEGNEALHYLFPWIRKPERGDPGYKIWGLEGFAIGGNPVQQRSFEGHTIGSSKTGFRYSRTGIDDVVNEKQAATQSIQDHNLAYIKAVALTMRERGVHRRERSRYGTVFPGFYVVGTPYHREDVNVRLDQEYRERGYKTVRIPIFIADDAGRPRWPERDTPEAIAGMREEMGARAFNMRCRLMVGGREHSMFPETSVDWAIKDGRAAEDRWRWCVVPERTKVIIGFDPASGRRVQHHGARYPAFVVYGLREIRPAGIPSIALRDFGPGVPVVPGSKPELFHHVIQWGRWEGLGFHSQCEKLVELARVYNCPVAFEDNTLQAAYGEEIRKIAPDVRTFSHTTGSNVRDPTQGVEQFEPILANQRLLIHADGAPLDAVKALRDELVGWPTYSFSDLVMALWIARRQFALHVQASEPVRVFQRKMPDYVQRFTGAWRR
jgi:hypothetical protein